MDTPNNQPAIQFQSPADALEYTERLEAHRAIEAKRQIIATALLNAVEHLIQAAKIAKESFNQNPSELTINDSNNFTTTESSHHGMQRPAAPISREVSMAIRELLQTGVRINEKEYMAQTLAGAVKAHLKILAEFAVPKDIIAQIENPFNELLSICAKDSDSQEESA